MNKEILDTLNELTKKPITDLALSYMEVVADNLEKDKEIERLNNIINELEKCLEEEQDKLAREISNIYEDSLGKTKLVNEDIFNEITKIKDKLKELKEGK